MVHERGFLDHLVPLILVSENFPPKFNDGESVLIQVTAGQPFSQTFEATG